MKNILAISIILLFIVAWNTGCSSTNADSKTTEEIILTKKNDENSKMKNHEMVRYTGFSSRAGKNSRL